MGTRSLSFICNESGEKIINLYRQFDGYPTGHGQELAEFLNKGKLVNGLRSGDGELYFNGAGCLAAQLVAHFKKESGGFYLYPTSAEDCGQDYEYWINVNDDNTLHIKIMDCGFNVFGMTQDETYEPLFEGNLQQFTKYCSSEKYGDVEINDNAFENSLIGREVLIKELKEGVVTVTFEKQDGSNRVMHCTLSNDIIPLFDTKGVTVTKKRTTNPDVLAVWDTEANGWRSFRFDSVKSILYPTVV